MRFVILFILVIPFLLLAFSGPAEIPISEGNISVHFCPQENCTSLFSGFIDNRTKCAFYDLEFNFSPADIIMDEGNAHGNVTKVSSGGIMHNKFCVKGDRVITGSFNPTENGETENDNNVLVINSESIASNYREYHSYLESEEGFSREHHVMLNNTHVYNYFCPMDDCEEKVSFFIDNARESVYFMTFSFTSNHIANRLIIKEYGGLDVKGVMESSQISRYSVYDMLKKHDIDVRKDDNPSMMHHKVFIIDNRTVITGSYNPTESGTERNDENILIIENKRIADAYLDEFIRIYK
ncbi:MAG: phospholipase D-like domain-containing protein [Nanobdellota archaeon]